MLLNTNHCGTRCTHASPCALSASYPHCLCESASCNWVPHRRIPRGSEQRGLSSGGPCASPASVSRTDEPEAP